MVMMEDWSEWSDIYNSRVSKTNYGFLDIQVKDLDIRFPLEDALFVFYLNFEEVKLISLEINDIIFVFDRFANPQSSVFHVIGRKYSPRSDLFLKTLQLGDISTEQWDCFPSFYNQIVPLIEEWINTINITDNNFNSMIENMSYNAMVLFDAPITFTDETAYGVMFNKEEITEALGKKASLDECIQRFIQYLLTFSDEQDNDHLKYTLIEGCHPTFSNDELDEDLITSDEAYKRWRKEFCHE